MLKVTTSFSQGTSPTCHDFGPPGCLKLDSPDVIPLLGMWGSLILTFKSVCVL